MGNCVNEKKAEMAQYRPKENIHTAQKAIQPDHLAPRQTHQDPERQSSGISDGGQPLKKQIKREMRVQEQIQLAESQLNPKISQTVKRIKQERQSGKSIQTYFMAAQELLAHGRPEEALQLLQAVLNQAKQLKNKAVVLYAQDQVQLLSKLATLQAPRSQKYKDYLTAIELVFAASLQYFLEDKITLINNLALAVQQSSRRERYKQAVELLKQSLKLQQQYFIVKDERVYYTKINLASAYYELKEWGKGFSLFEATLKELYREREKCKKKGEKGRKEKAERGRREENERGRKEENERGRKEGGDASADYGQLIKIAEGNFKYYIDRVSIL